MKKTYCLKLNKKVLVFTKEENKNTDDKELYENNLSCIEKIF